MAMITLPKASTPDHTPFHGHSIVPVLHPETTIEDPLIASLWLEAALKEVFALYLRLKGKEKVLHIEGRWSSEECLVL